jgi:hypothetical protein
MAKSVVVKNLGAGIVTTSTVMWSIIMYSKSLKNTASFVYTHSFNPNG